MSGTQTDVDREELLSAVEAGPARCILSAASRERLSAEELADRCDVSPATVYRRVEELQEYGFVEEDIDIDRSGNNRKRYETTLERVCLLFDDGFDVSVRVRRDFVDRFADLWNDLEQSGTEFGW